MRLLCICFLLLGIIPAFAEESDKPSFVLIFIDDMGYGDIGPFGSTKNRTPHLDQMAEEGMKLTSFYAAPVCSASRAQLLTGSYAPRVSVPGVFFPAGGRGLNPDEHTVAEYLQESGYATACFGKWHLGDQPDFLPTRHGFDTYFGIPYSNDMGRVSTETGLKVHPLMQDETVGELIEDEAQRRITREYTERSVAFIEEKSKADEPFFLYLPHTAMHVPLFPHPDFAGKSNNGTYGDWVEEVDWSVGQILETLRRLKIENNTLVLFTSDNGPWASKGDAGGESGLLRGAKGGTLEGGVREPTIAWWPGKIAAGSQCDAIAGTTDVLPTFVSLAGGSLRDSLRIDGKNIAPLLLGETADSPHEAWHYFQGSNLQAVRSGPWKLALTAQSIGMGFKEQPADIRTEGRLYHLENDLGETTDVASDHPDVVARLRKLADAMIAEMKDGGVRPPGVVENPVTLYPSIPKPSRKSPSKSKGKSKPIDWSGVKAGDIIEPVSAPAIAGSAFTVFAKISGNKKDGVIVSHGGSAVGYVLYVKGNRAVFSIRHGNDSVQRVTSLSELSEDASISAGLGKDGTLSLTIDQKDTLTSPSSGLLSRHPQESFSIGFDERNRVDPESPPGQFKGNILKLSIELGK